MTLADMLKKERNYVNIEREEERHDLLDFDSMELNIDYE